MPKNYRIGDLKLLLEHLAKHTNESLDHYGTGRMSDKIQGTITHKYLYDNLLQKVRKAENNEQVLKLVPNKLDELCVYIGYENFTHFLSSVSNPIEPVLMALTGSYYSYVRKNSKEGVLLRSPVKIESSDNRVLWSLKGPVYNFEGELTYGNSCLYCLMTSAQAGKSFYHVYKIGKSLGPKVLMGIFTGVSSAYDPIGGRCILVRQYNDLDLANEKLSINTMLGSTNKTSRQIAGYFRNYEDNNLKITNPYGFDFDDLD